MFFSVRPIWLVSNTHLLPDKLGGLFYLFSTQDTTAAGHIFISETIMQKHFQMCSIIQCSNAK